MARAKPRGRLASVHADEGARNAAAGADRARRRRMAVRFRRQALPRRRQLVVGEPVRPCQSAHQRRAGGATARTRSRDARRLHSPSGDRTVGTPGRARPHGPGPRVLRLGRRVGDRNRAQDELSLLAQRGQTGQAQLREPGGQLSWRDAGRAVRDRRCDLSRHLRAAAQSQYRRTLSGPAARNHAGRRGRRARSASVRSTTRRPPR